MTNKRSIWQTAEYLINADYIWIVDGPWLDAEYEDTLDEALAHLQLCCEAVLDNEGSDGLLEGYKWLECREDTTLLETLLDNIKQDHKWYNDIVELLFMNTLAGA